MPVEMTCPVCQKVFRDKPSHVQRRTCCSRKCKGERQSEIFSGENAPNYKTGREVRSNGYIHVLCKGHPFAYKGKVAEHRLIMERYLGRYITSNEIVHHKNGDKTDNRIENLELWSLSEHTRYHALLREPRRGWKHTAEWKRATSQRVKGKRLKPPIVKVCGTCNKSFEVSPSLNFRQYCGRGCAYARTFTGQKPVKVSIQ